MGYSEGVDTILTRSELWGNTNGNSWKEAKKQTNAGEGGRKNEKEAEKNWHRRQLRKWSPL